MGLYRIWKCNMLVFVCVEIMKKTLNVVLFKESKILQFCLKQLKHKAL